MFHTNNRYVAIITILMMVIAPCCFGKSTFVVNADNSVAELSDLELKKIITGTKRFWTNGEPTLVAFYSDKGSIELLEEVSGIPYGRLKQTWTRLAFTGRAFQVKKYKNLEALLAFVSENEGAIACIPQSAVTDQIRNLKQIDQSVF